MAEFGDKVEQALKEIEEAGDEILFPAVNVVLGLMKRRIFQMGKDTNDLPIGIKHKNRGKYSNPWARARRLAGRQTQYIDLSFFGDMMRAMITGIWQGQIAIGWNSKDQDMIMNSHEVRYKTKIEQPSKSEMEAGRKVFIKGLRAKALEAFQENLKAR